MKKILWPFWIVLSLALASYLGFKMVWAENRSQFIIGDATHGHHQIEMACETCHTDAFGGGEVLQNACLNCHKDELAEAQDSHPAKKFTNPRNADLLDILDARYCISCHVEHQKEQTREMGVTLPDDYCYHCHVDIGEERESHANLAFDSCATAGCHNFHDNRALYENFLVTHANQPWLKESATIAESDYAHWFAAKNAPKNAFPKNEFLEKMSEHSDIAAIHLEDAHGQAGLSCGSCHGQGDEWLAKPTINECSTCHVDEAKGFVAGKHGMRLSEKLSQPLSPLTPADAAPENLTFHADAMDVEHGCNTCHSAHEFDTQYAAVESCLTCHADEHSLAFTDSPHGALWQQAQANELEPQQAVSCATCHMPRVEVKKNGETHFRVEHNQNWNLRPNEKMIRSVCMECHSLEFSIDALASPELIRNNFKGQPEVHIESMDWALKRE